MLEHSRGVTGERREVDLNALASQGPLPKPPCSREVHA
jgi:hypothetical protein